jgi:LmbE family N-acetylglucosaminyl deacetylase
MDEELTKVMVILAHPDDPEFVCGGSVARWAGEGKEVVYVVATRGDKGTDDPGMSPERLMEIREAEQRAAAALLGVRDVIFMGYPDGELLPDLRLRRDITRLIRQVRPDVVVTFDPLSRYYDNYINHPDHRAIGEATLDAIYPTARDRFNFVELWRDEGLEPHKVREVYLGGAQNPDVQVDITDTIDAKIAALCEHKSQIHDPAGLAERIRQRASTSDDTADPPYVERFKRITLT